MGFISMRAGFPIALLAASACTVLNAGNADAVLVFEFIQQGSDVALNVSGSLSGLPSSSPITNNFTPVISPGLALISTGPFLGQAFSASGPQDFGGGGSSTSPFSYIGDNVVLFGATGDITLPSSYVQGNAISGSGLFSGQTLASLNLSSTTPGLLGTWTVGSDTVEVRVGAQPSPSPAAAPGPLPLLGAGAAFAASRRLRARLRPGSSSPQA